MLTCKACAFTWKCADRWVNGVVCLIDNVYSGLLCSPCCTTLASAYPPLTLRWFQDKFPSGVSKIIERMVYPVWNLIGGHKRKGAFALPRDTSVVAECAIIGHQTVERITLRNVTLSATGNFSVSGRSQEALIRRAAAAAVRGWTRQRRQEMQWYTSQWSTSQSSTSRWSSSAWHNAWSNWEWHDAWVWHDAWEWHGAWSSSESQTHGGGYQLVRD